MPPPALCRWRWNRMLVVEPDVVGCLDERRLDLVDGPGGMALAQQSGSSRDVRSGHARPRECPPAAGYRREHVGSRPGDVGLEAERDRGRSGRREVRHDVRGGVSSGRDGRNRDRARCVARRADGAGTELLEVVPGRDDRHDTCRGGPVESECHDVAGGLYLGLADGEVDHVHTVRDGCLDRGDELRCVPVLADAALGRHGQRPVVPDVRAWGDPRDHGSESGRARITRRDPGDVCAVRLPRVEGCSVRRRRLARRRERSGDDDLGSGVCDLPLREPRGHDETGRIEEWMRLIDAHVDDPDLDPVAGAREVRPPELRSSDLIAGGACGDRVGGRREDLGDAGKPLQAGDVERRNGDGEAVEDEPVAPADASPGNVGCERMLERHLSPRDGRARSTCGRGLRCQTHDDLGGRSSRCRR